MKTNAKVLQMGFSASSCSEHVDLQNQHFKDLEKID